MPRSGLLSLWGALALIASAADAQDSGNTLLGRKVTFTVATFNDPAAPFLVSRPYVATVGPGPEFGTVREGTNGLDVVPALIDFDARSLLISYSKTEAGYFAEANFNGYLLEFLTDCVLVAGAALDRKATTLPLGDDDLTITPQALMINVSGLSYTPADQISITIDVLDCPLS